MTIGIILPLVISATLFPQLAEVGTQLVSNCNITCINEKYIGDIMSLAGLGPTLVEHVLQLAKIGLPLV